MAWLGAVIVLLCEWLSSAVEYKLDGDAYIIYHLNSTHTTSLNSQPTIHMLFRTAEPSGLLIHGRGTKGDFFTMELVRGKLRYASVFDRRSARPGYHDVIVGDDLGDDQWHQIDIERRRNQVVIKLDITREYITAKNAHKSLDINLDILVGGFQQNTTKGPSHQSSPPPSLTNIVFKGCMEDVTYNKVNILQAVKDKSNNVRVIGRVKSKCANDLEYFPPATLKTPTSFIQLNYTRKQSLNLKFKFRTFEPTGILVHHIFSTSGKGSLLLELVEGNLELDVSSKRPHIKVNLSLKTPSLADGLWHKIQLNFSREEIAIEVNNEMVKKVLNVSQDAGRLFENAVMTIGYSHPGKTAIIGCIKEIHLNGAENVLINYAKTKDVDLDKCYLIDRCFSNPCLNNGHCVQHDNKAQCDCSETGHLGIRCEKSSEDLGKNLGETTSSRRSNNATILSSGSSILKPTKSTARFVTSLFQNSLSIFRLTNHQATKILTKLPSTVSKTPSIFSENASQTVNFVPILTYTSENVMTSFSKEVVINVRSTTLLGYLAHSTIITKAQEKNLQPTTSIAVGQTIPPSVTRTVTSSQPPENKVTAIGLLKKQLFVYLFLCILLILFVGFIVIISVKISLFTRCKLPERSGLCSTESLSGHRPFELNERDAKEDISELTKRGAKSRRPSSLNDSGIDRSDSG